MQHTTIDFLRKIADELRACEHRGKGAIIARAQEALGLKSAQAVYTRLAKVGYDSERQKRTDAGIISLSRAEAEQIAALLKATTRDTGKRLMSVDDAIDVLRTEGRIRAQHIDQNTGECRDLSTSAILNAMRTYGLHHTQLAAPRPHVQLASLHPNHVWEMDFSVCVLFYLRGDTGLRVMEEKVFNRNKPANVAKVENFRVQRVVIVDHTTHAIWVTYALGSENVETSINVLIRAFIEREGFPPHGVCFVLYTDQGPGFKGGVFDNFTRRMMITHLRHESSQKREDAARSTGSVEGANNIIERSFESRLGIGKRVESIEELNEKADRWTRWYGSNKVVERHGMTRFNAWLKITESQLRKAPAEEVLRSMAHTHPVTRTVTGERTIQFAHKDVGTLYYSLRDVPGLESVYVGEKVNVVINPYAKHEVIVVRETPDGKGELHYPLVPISMNEWGYAAGAPVIGESFVSLPETDSERANKRLIQIAMGVDTPTEAATAKRAGRIAFAGLDAHKPLENVADVTYLPKRGTDLEADAPAYIAPVHMLSLVDAAQELRERIGPDAWTPEHYATLSRLYPNGVADNELDAAQARITTRQGLRIVSGGASA